MDEKLRDIRALEHIDDISLYLFVALVLFILAVVGGIFYMIYRHFRDKKRDLTKKEVLKRLKEIDLSNSKEASYKITKYARYLADDERSKKILAQLEQRLKRYKFIPNPPEFDQESINYYNLFLEVVDG